MRSMLYRRRNASLALAVFPRATSSGVGHWKETSPAVDTGCMSARLNCENHIFRIAFSHSHSNNTRFRILEHTHVRWLTTPYCPYRMGSPITSPFLAVFNCATIIPIISYGHHLPSPVTHSFDNVNCCSRPQTFDIGLLNMANDIQWFPPTSNACSWCETPDRNRLR